MTSAERKYGLLYRALPFGALAATVLLSGTARAQSDVAPPLPNVLILLDTSGSMERMPNGTLPLRDDGTTLDPSTGSKATATIARNRWVSALEVLGGSIKNYTLLAVDRSKDDFKNEFGLGGANPYDAGYGLYHYRPLSNSCAIGSNSLTKTATWPNDWTTWGISDFGWRKWNGSFLQALGTCASTDYQTDGLGVLDTFRDQARFGLMTFDNAPDSGSGWTGTGHDFVSGQAGLWSYFPGWKGTGTIKPQYGWPAACDPSTAPATHIYENGARNPSAAPWEGPLVGFAGDDSTAALRAVNDRIRYAMLASRPYGATPIGPMLADAQQYMWTDPDGPSTVDPSISCRGNFIILITDGFPNSDLRDAPTTSEKCEDNADPSLASVWNSTTVSGCTATTASKGCCPSRRAEDIARELSHPPSGKPQVSTFVVGFSLTDAAGAAVDCTSSAVDPVTGGCGTTVLPGDPRYPCCTLNQIAYNGNTGKAYIANTADTLRAALVKAMAAATATTSTSRTVPVFAGVASSTGANSSQNEFRSSFKVNPFTAWTGTLERIRYQCVLTAGSGTTPQAIPFSAAQDDDLGTVIAKTTNRNFYSWNGVLASSGDNSTTSIRRNISTADNDGVSHQQGVSIEGAGTGFTSSSNMTPEAMNITSSSCSDEPSPAQCKLKYLNYALGLPATRVTWLDRVGLAFGDIYHATPVSVGVPDAFLRDESYTDFRRLQSTRLPMLLVATNDGMLHGIQTNLTDTSNPELWAFIPPAVLPSIPKQYDGAHALLLDMAPVVKDVAFGIGGGSTPPWGRTRDQAKGGVANWRTIAVGGLTTGRGFYAVDVTNPARPEFLWQLTTIKDSVGGDRNLFGTYPAKPAIGTVYYAEAGGSPVETPVAFLPGGEGTLSATWPTQCNRWTTPIEAGVRTKTRCWRGAGNSFTVVRLYDGKILRTFRNDPLGKTPDHPAETDSPVTAFQTAGVASSIVGTYANIDAPLTGAVAIYPAAIGAVTTRAFVGDEDGDLWKADFTDTNPTNWTFGLFHDSYINTTFTATSQPPQAVSLAPVLTVDRLGRITVIYATGDQNNFAAVNVNNMWSVSEQLTTTLSGTTASTVTNWKIPFTGGVTPTGPLSLFSGNLYFSTFTPDVASASACLKGQGTIWGVDYAETEPGTGSPGLPRARLQQQPGDVIVGTCPPSVPNTDARPGLGNFFRCLQLDPGTIVFGAGVTQRPSCVDTASSATTDPYTGATSSHQTVTGINTGDFQLVAQTGPKSPSTGGGGVGGTSTKTYTRTLVPPVSVTKIDTWAASIE